MQSLLKFYLKSEKNIFINEEINFSFIGDIDKFEDKIKQEIIDLKKTTEKFNKLHLTLALNYGSRNEILNAFKSLARKKKRKIIEDDISLNLMTKKSS